MAASTSAPRQHTKERLKVRMAGDGPGADVEMDTLDTIETRGMLTTTATYQLLYYITIVTCSVGCKVVE